MPNLISGNISTLGGAVVTPISAAFGISVTISGTWTDTLSFQASYDGGSTWHSIALGPGVAGTGNPVGVTSTTGNGTWVGLLSAGATFQVISTGGAHTGTANVAINAIVPNNGKQVIPLLDLAARTQTVYAPTFVDPASKGALFFLNVSTIAGTASLGVSARLTAMDPISGAFVAYANGASTTTAPSELVMLVYPGSLSGENSAIAPKIQGPMPAIWGVQIWNADGAGVAYTCSLGVQILP